MDCNPTFPCDLPFPGCSYRLPLSPFPCLPLCFEGLSLPSLSSLLCLPWVAGIQIAGTLGLGWLPFAGLACRDSVCLAAGIAWLPSENGPQTFLKKRLARCGMFVPINTQRGENRRAKQTNERNEMNTAELSTAELLAAEERAFAAKRDAWASVIFAHTEEELDRATSAYQRAVAAYSQAHTAWYNSQPSQPGRQTF